MSRNTNSFFEYTSAQHEEPCYIARKLTLDLSEKCYEDKMSSVGVFGRYIAFYNPETVSVKCRAAIEQLSEAQQKCWNSLTIKK